MSSAPAKAKSAHPSISAGSFSAQNRIPERHGPGLATLGAMLLGLLVAGVLASTQEGGRSNEALLREVFVKEFKDKDPIRRLEAVRRLSSQSDEKTILLLVDALRDPDPVIRKAVVETIA